MDLDTLYESHSAAKTKLVLGIVFHVIGLFFTYVSMFAPYFMIFVVLPAFGIGTPLLIIGIVKITRYGRLISLVQRNNPGLNLSVTDEDDTSYCEKCGKYADQLFELEINSDFGTRYVKVCARCYEAETGESVSPPQPQPMAYYQPTPVYYAQPNAYHPTAQAYTPEPETFEEGTCEKCGAHSEYLRVQEINSDFGSRYIKVCPRCYESAQRNQVEQSHTPQPLVQSEPLTQFEPVTQPFIQPQPEVVMQYIPKPRSDSSNNQ